MGAMHPDHACVTAHVEACAAAHPQLVRLQRGTSSEGRPLLAAICSDPDSSAEAKRHALIVGGRHGNEESSRGLALACLDWLLGEGRPLLSSHIVTIIPNANPDACERDCYWHPLDIDVGADLDSSEPIPESRFIDDLATAFPPDLLIDLHACGHVGCSHDLALYPEPRRYTEDGNSFQQICEDMCQQAQGLSGIPQLHHPMRWWDETDRGICARYYRRYKALAILIETAESNTLAHPWDLRMASGMAKIRHGLALGLARHPRLPWPGYATDLVIGSYHLGLLAVGGDVAARRASRIALWQQADAVATVGADSMPEADTRKRIAVDYRGEVLRTPVGVQIQVRHQHPPRRVLVDGEEQEPLAIWQHGPSTFVVARLPGLDPGRHVVDFDFA